MSEIEPLLVDEPTSIEDRATIDDPARLAALDASGLLDEPANAALDRLVRLACKLIDTPVSLISLIKADRQVFAGLRGLREPWATRAQTPLSHSFCRHVVDKGAPFIVEDARTHPLVKDNLAIADLGVIAYLGVPLTTPDGHVLGSLCVIDDSPRRWSAEDLSLLNDLSASVMNEIALRYELTRRQEAERTRDLLIEELNHRVRNLFSLVHGLVRGSGTDDPAVAAFQDGLAAQLATLVDAHSLVFENMAADGVLGDDIVFGTLVEALVLPVAGPGRIVTRGRKVTLGSRQALYAALLLHELTTNALKHGALSVPEGEVEIAWRKVGTELYLDWTERGGPPAGPPDQPGFGAELIEIITAGSRRADAAMEFGDDGFVCRVGINVR